MQSLPQEKALLQREHALSLRPAPLQPLQTFSRLAGLSLSEEPPASRRTVSRPLSCGASSTTPYCQLYCGFAFRALISTHEPSASSGAPLALVIGVPVPGGSRGAGG